MRYFIFFLLTAFLLTGSLAAKSSVQNDESSYLIEKIQRKNEWYIIYARKQDSVFKIISEVDTGECSNEKLNPGNFITCNWSQILKG